MSIRQIPEKNSTTSMQIDSVDRSELAASSASAIVDVNLASTSQWLTGALANQADCLITAGTHAFVGSSTETNASTVAISGPPAAGANCTQTNPLAFHVRSGASQFDGAIRAADAGMVFSADAAVTSITHSGTGATGSVVFTVNSVATLTLYAAGYTKFAVPALHSSTPTLMEFDDGSGVVGYMNVYSATGEMALIGRNGMVITAGSGVGTLGFKVTTTGNVVVGATTAGATAQKCLALSNAATAPTTSADLVHLYAVDLSAGNATIGIFTETTVAADAARSSTHSLKCVINGTTYRVLLSDVA
jgi:hypothetical protein